MNIEAENKAFFFFKELFEEQIMCEKYSHQEIFLQKILMLKREKPICFVTDPIREQDN